MRESHFFELQKCKIRTDIYKLWKTALLKRNEHYYL